MSSKTRKTKARYVFTLFSQLDVSYNSQPKMCCKFCKWTVTKNATRMAHHIINGCKSCPIDIKRRVYVIQTKDIKHPNLTIKKELEENNSLINNDDELTRISATSNNDSTSLNNIEYNELSSSSIADAGDNIVVQEEVIEFSKLFSDNHTETHNYSKPNREKSQSDNKYKYTLISANNNNETTNSNNQINKNDFKLKTNESINELPMTTTKDDEFKKESRAFGNWVTSEIDEIDDLEILNQMKHDISKILYNSKKDYLQKLKKS